MSSSTSFNGTAILELYLVFFGLSFLCELVLELLNLREVRKRSAALPEAFKGRVDEETYKKSIGYTLARGRFGIFSHFYSSALVLILLPSGILGALHLAVREAVPGLYLPGIAFILLIAFLFSVLELPLSLYSTFVIEERFGFNRSTFSLWLKDLIKGYLLALVLTVPLLMGLFYFMDKAGFYWWLYAFIFVAAFQLILTFVYPTWIAPIFNKFTPLEEGGLKERIIGLAEKLKFKTSGIFVMDGSRRSSHANAYFTGLGSRKRVVLFDTLIKELNQDELLAVLAHEIGHEKKHHIKKSLVLSLLLTLFSLYVLNLLLHFHLTSKHRPPPSKNGSPAGTPRRIGPLV